MPDWEFRNGSTISTIESPTISINTDGIYARSGSGQRLIRLDANSMIYNSNTEYIGRFESEEPKIRYIKQYNYVPEQFQLHKVNNEEELYLGIELEIDNGGQNETNAQYIIDFMNSTTENVYCKHDGSLNDGFEIVTHPCTIEYHKQLPYKELFKELSKKAIVHMIHLLVDYMYI